MLILLKKVYNLHYNYYVSIECFYVYAFLTDFKNISMSIDNLDNCLLCTMSTLTALFNISMFIDYSDNCLLCAMSTLTSRFYFLCLLIALLNFMFLCLLITLTILHSVWYLQKPLFFIISMSINNSFDNCLLCTMST